jgi:hypothetical protein
MAAWHTAAENGDIEGIAKLVTSRAKSRKDAFAHFFEDPLNDKDSLDEVFGKLWLFVCTLLGDKENFDRVVQKTLCDSLSLLVGMLQNQIDAGDTCVFGHSKSPI